MMAYLIRKFYDGRRMDTFADTLEDISERFSLRLQSNDPHSPCEVKLSDEPTKRLDVFLKDGHVISYVAIR